MEDVDVLGVLLALLLDEALALSGSEISWIWLKNTALIAASGTHHRDLRLREGQARIGLKRRARHRIEAGPVGLPDDHRELRDGRLGDRADHLRPVSDDPLTLHVLADHEPGNVGQEQKGDVERVAVEDEPRPLVGESTNSTPPFTFGWFATIPMTRPSRRAYPTTSSFAQRGVNLEERVLVASRSDQVLDVEGILLVLGNYLRDRRAGGRLGRRGRRGVLPPVRRHVGEVAPG